jgi:hypothetical protein
MNDEASLARKTAGPAISSAEAHLAIGIWSRLRRRKAGSAVLIGFIEVSTQPGHSALMRMFAGASSIASARVKPTSPCLAAV